MYTLKPTTAHLKGLFVAVAAMVLFAQGSFAQQHLIPQPKHCKIQPGSITPWQAQHPGHGNTGHSGPKALMDTSDVLDYSTYNELVASSIQIAYNGSWNSPNPQVVANELSSLLTPASYDNSYVTYAQVMFDSLAFANYTNLSTYSLPRAGTTVRLDSVSMFMGIYGDTTVADGLMSNDSLVISVYRVVGHTVSPTPVFTVVDSGYSGLSQFFTGGSYLKYVTIGIGQTFNPGESFAVRVTYLNKDSSSHCLLSYSYADSCGSIVISGTTYASPAYPSPFAHSSSFGQVDSVSPGVDSVITLDNQITYSLGNNNIPLTCSYIYYQNWEILAHVTVNLPYSTQIQSQNGSTTACNGNALQLNALVFGTDSPNITYSWAVNGGATLSNTNGATDSLIIPANVYNNVTVTLTVNNGASNVTDSLVINNCHVQVFAGFNQAVCSGSTVILQPSAYNGTPPYSYQWSASAGSLFCTNCTNASATVTQNTVYTVTVTDATGASATASVSYTVSGISNTMQLSATNTIVNCFSNYDTTTVTVTGGVPPFSFNWGGSITTPNAQSPQTYNYGYPGGPQVITVTDSNGCISSLFDTVLSAGPTALIVSSVAPGCPNSTNGQIIGGATGGVAPYTYTWGNITGSDTLTGATAGTYFLQVTDANGCTSTIAYTLAAAQDYSYYVFTQATSANCQQPGIIISNASGGTPPYIYMWSNGETSQTMQSSTPGNYTVVVTDSLGCQTTGFAYLQTSCQSIINGTAFVDTTGNCNPVGAQVLSGLIIVATGSNGAIYYGYSDANGNYSINVLDTGTYTLSAYNYGNGSCGYLNFCGNINQTVYIPAIGDTSNNNFIGFSGAAGFNLGIHPGWTSANPGFTKEYWVFYYNSGATTYNGPATITLNYDPNLTYLYTSDQPAPVNNTATHTLTWNVSSVPGILGNNWIQLNGFFQVPANLSLNYLLQTTYTITPTAGDCDTSDNYYTYSEPVTGSHDPNEKTVSPAGPVTEADSVLTYTIHFQNTGTDSTHFVIIKDTLSPYLDPATVRNIASSDKYSAFNISGNGILTWTFNPLRIVDSMTDPAASKRFIMFTVHKKANLPIGTTINNTASIYFDYNPAVVTNTVRDTAALPTYIFEISNSNVSVKAYPNPFSDVTHIVVNGLNEKFGFELYDVTGRLQQSIPAIDNNQFDLHKGQLANGVYLYRILVTGKPAAYGKLVVE